jgi:hypothetical protein
MFSQGRIVAVFALAACIALTNGCSNFKSTSTSDSASDSAVLVCGDETFSLKYEFPKEDRERIAAMLETRVRLQNCLPPINEPCTLVVSSSAEKKEWHIEALGNDDVTTLGKDMWEEYKVRGLDDLLRKPLMGLEIEYMGTCPIEKVSDAMLDFLSGNGGFRRVCTELGAAPFEADIRTKSYHDDLRKSWRAFQEWYKANKGKIHWDEAQRKYVVS